jgi:hypothetical protein
MRAASNAILVAAGRSWWRLEQNESRVHCTDGCAMTRLLRSGVNRDFSGRRSRFGEGVRRLR